MRAEQFIKDHGLEKARGVVEGAPPSGQPLYFNTTNGVYLFTGYRNMYFMNDVWGTEDDHQSMQDQTFKAVSVTHLKRLVESVDLVKAYGGIESCKQSLYMLHELTEDPQPIREAVHDYKSIYGGSENA